MAKKMSKDKKVMKGEDDSRLFAFLAVFLSIIGFVIAYATKKNNKYVMHYAKQSLVLFIAFVIFWVLAAILFFIPVIGALISFVVYALLIAAWVIGWVYALSGVEKEIPVIGKYAEKLRI